MNAFFKSQFSYCPFSWILHSRTSNNKINRLRERCLCITCNGNTSSFTDLFGIDNSVSVHHRHVQALATELYEFVNGLSPKLASGCFKLNNMIVYNPRNRSTFYPRPVRIVLHGTESLSYLGPKIWELVPSDIKTFHYSQSSKNPLNNGRHMPVHVGFVETASIKLVSFSL